MGLTGNVSPFTKMSYGTLSTFLPSHSLDFITDIPQQKPPSVSSRMPSSTATGTASIPHQADSSSASWASPVPARSTCSPRCLLSITLTSYKLSSRVGVSCHAMSCRVVSCRVVSCRIACCWFYLMIHRVVYKKGWMETWRNEICINHSNLVE